MRGFTLIEVIIAVFLLTMGILGLLYMFPSGLQIGKGAQMTSVAIQLGQAKIEEMTSKHYDDAVLTVGTTTEDYGDIVGFESFKRITRVSCVEPQNLSEVFCDYDLLNNPEPIKKAEISVFWKLPSGITEKNIKLASLIAKR